MIKIQKVFPKDAIKETDTFFEEVNSFLFEHLGEFGDPKEDIAAAMNYSLSTQEGKGGFIVTAHDTDNSDEVVGAVVLNETGMKGYIPENILVYIAVNREYRGRKIGKKLMEATLETAEGAVALHVEPDNPAKFLYEKLGFTNKYLEMRFHK